MFKNEQRFIRRRELECVKMSPRLTKVARITACTVLLISYARAEPLRERIFHVEEISYIECRENRFDVRDF